MGSRTPEPAPEAKAAVIVPALAAYAVAPIVGSVVLLLVAAGSVAFAVGALSAMAGYRIRKSDAMRASAVDSARSSTRTT